MSDVGDAPAKGTSLHSVAVQERRVGVRSRGEGTWVLSGAGAHIQLCPRRASVQPQETPCWGWHGNQFSVSGYLLWGLQVGRWSQCMHSFPDASSPTPWKPSACDAQRGGDPFPFLHTSTLRSKAGVAPAARTPQEGQSQGRGWLATGLRKP